MLFPIRNATRNPETNSTTVVGSPVLAATVGPGLDFVGLAEPVRILLRLNEELEVGGVYYVVCVELRCDLGRSVGVPLQLLPGSSIITIK